MTSALDETELDALIGWIVLRGGAGHLDQLLRNSHRLEVKNDSLQTYERYFRSELSYQDFRIHIPEIVIKGDDVMGARVQFKRASGRWQPLLNGNRRLVKRLRKRLVSCYDGEQPIVDKYEFEGERQGTRTHFGNDYSPAARFWWKPDSTFEQWGSETAIFDEPFSSGQTPHEQTKIRNDFVILRFARKN